MTTLELKSNFHQLIDVIQDDKMLKDMFNCIADYAIKHDHQLSTAQIERMKKSISQIESGQIVSNAQVQQNLKKWLTK